MVARFEMNSKIPYAPFEFCEDPGRWWWRLRIAVSSIVIGEDRVQILRLKIDHQGLIETAGPSAL